MIKKIIKIFLIIFLILILSILYLSIFGLKTDRFNNQITKNVSKINKKIDINLSEVNYLLNPYNFTVSVKTKNTQILFEGRNFVLKNIQTNIPIKSLLNNQFLINDLKIKTKEIKLKDISTLVRSFKNSPQLFIIDRFIKDGLVAINVNLNFDKKGKIKEDYKIEGSVTKAKLNILNQLKLNKLNFNFDINKNIYLLKRLNTELNNIKITSPFIEIKKKNDFFTVNGQLLNQKKNFDSKEFKTIFANLLNNIDLRKIEFSSTNNFSFNINKKLKFNNLKVESIINLNQLIFNEKNLNLKSYIPSFVEEIKLEEHKIIINYNKNKFDIKGNGNILLEEKSDNLSYQILKDKNNLSFNSIGVKDSTRQLRNTLINIPVTAIQGDTQLYSAQNSNRHKLFDKTISLLEIKIVDENGNEIDFNGVSWYLSLQLVFTYIKENKVFKDFDDTAVPKENEGGQRQKK